MNECHQNATCYNNLGGYSCVCNHGYRGDNGTVCTGVDIAHIHIDRQGWIPNLSHTHTHTYIHTHTHTH